MTVDRVEVRLYGDLADIARGAGRDGIVEVPIGNARSVKDLIESTGVPHTEVGMLLVDGEPVTFDHLVAGPSRVAVFPHLEILEPPVPLRDTDPPRRFVIDVHLGTLARNLRLLGFDTWYDTDADDPRLASLAVDDDRTLLTRDRGLLMRSEIVHGHCVRSEDPLHQTLEVARRFGLAPHLAPFTRCVRCNGTLADVTLHEVHDDVPPLARGHDRYVRCAGCGRVYWPGTHHDRLTDLVTQIRRRLEGDRPSHR